MSQILSGFSGGSAAAVAWGVLAGLQAPYFFHPDHRDLYYAAGRVLDGAGALLEITTGWGGMRYPLCDADVLQALKYVSEERPQQFARAILFGRSDLLTRATAQVVGGHSFLQETYVLSALRDCVDYSITEPPEEWVNPGSLLGRSGDLFARYLFQQKDKSAQDFLSHTMLLREQLLVTKRIPRGQDPSSLGRRQGAMLGLIIGGSLRCSALYTKHDRERNELISRVVDTAVDSLAALAGPGAAGAAALGGLIKAGCKALQKERNFGQEIQKLRSEFLIELQRLRGIIRSQNLPAELDFAEAISWFDIAIHACGEA